MRARQGSVELAVPGAGRWTLVTRLVGYRGERLEVDLARATVTQVLVGPRRDDSAVRDSLYLAPPASKPAPH